MKTKDEIHKLSQLYNIDLSQCFADIECINKKIKTSTISTKNKDVISSFMKNAENIMKSKVKDIIHETTY